MPNLLAKPDRATWNVEAVGTHAEPRADEQPQPAEPQLWDNTDRIYRVLYRLKPYRKIAWGAFKKGVPVLDLLRAQFPFLLPDAPVPPMLSLEFTSLCNLKCLYCNTLMNLRKNGFMSPETFANLLHNIRQSGISRVRIQGGESTLHPEFGSMVRELAKSVKYLSITTNGQWIRDCIPYDLLQAPFDLIEISIDAGGKDTYEASRRNGSYDRLMDNLRHLRQLRDRLGAPSLLQIRLMLRPSTRAIAQEEADRLAPLVDTVMRQYIVKIKDMDYSEDVFMPVHQATNTYPRCSVPFKNLEVKWNGDVPLCGTAANQVESKRLILGNINGSSIQSLWNGKTMKQYRWGHRMRDESKMPFCRGCTGY
jgi:MoaA/NifB/PqqE/SkfB family radical SAM enzyme